MLNVNIVEGSDDLRNAIVESLSRAGHLVSGLPSAESWVDEAEVADVDLLIVNARLPGESGLHLAQRFRAIRPRAGLIVLTGRDMQVAGYESGADICIDLPVQEGAISAAVAALQRRLRSDAEMPPTIRLDTRGLMLRGAGRDVPVSRQEAALLEAFARAPQARLESWQILEIFEREGWTYSRSNVGVSIFRLGAKLRATGVESAPRPLRAIRNWGYQLCEPVVLEERR